MVDKSVGSDTKTDAAPDIALEALRRVKKLSCLALSASAAALAAAFSCRTLRFASSTASNSFLASLLGAYGLSSRIPFEQQVSRLER